MSSIDKKTYQNQGNNTVLNLISANEQSILDIGCGGGNGKILQSKGHHLVGITISESEKSLNAPFYDDIYIYII